jgi:hypothetical protein
MPHRRTIGTRHFHHAFIFVALGGACRSVIKQGYEVDPPACPGCSVAMRLLAFIEPPEVIA